MKRLTALVLVLAMVMTMGGSALAYCTHLRDEGGSLVPTAVGNQFYNIYYTYYPYSNGHTVDRHSKFQCSECWREGVFVETVRFEAHEVWNGVCKVCGYKIVNAPTPTPVPEFCSHSWDGMQGMYFPQFSYTKQAEWYVYSPYKGSYDHSVKLMWTVTCNTCGESITNVYADYYAAEACTYTDGVCTKCGGMKPGYTPSTPTPTPTPLTPAPPTDAPVTAAPITPAPVTPAPVTSAPSTEVPGITEPGECQHENPVRDPIESITEYYDEEMHAVTTTYQIVCQCGMVIEQKHKEIAYFEHTFVSNQCKYCHYHREFKILAPTNTDELIRSDFKLKWTGWVGADNYSITMQNLTTGGYVFDHEIMFDEPTYGYTIETNVLNFAYYYDIIGCDGMRITIDALDSYGYSIASDTVIVKFLGYPEHEYDRNGVCVNCYFDREGNNHSLTTDDILAIERQGELPIEMFDANNVKNIYYLRSVNGGSHTALLMIDENGKGLHFCYYGDGSNFRNDYTSITLDIFSEAELLQFFQTGAVYYNPLSNNDEFGQYPTYYDMVDVACLLSSEEKYQSVVRCFELFAYAHNMGIDYGLLTQNCDDLAYYVLYGKYSASVIPNETFNTLWMKAEKKGGTYRRIDHPNVDENGSAWYVEVHTDRYDEVLEDEAKKNDAKYMLVVILDRAILRKEPNVTSDYVLTGEVGTHFTYLGTEGNWYKVMLSDGREAYVVRDKCKLK